jgi:hypothetical protein
MSNHPITPLAFAQVNHDHLRIELVEPWACPAWCASSGLTLRPWSTRTFPRYRGRDRPVVCSGAHRVGRNPGGAETLIARADRASWCASRPTRMLVW